MLYKKHQYALQGFGYRLLKQWKDYGLTGIATIESSTNVLACYSGYRYIWSKNDVILSVRKH